MVKHQRFNIREEMRDGEVDPDFEFDSQSDVAIDNGKKVEIIAGVVDNGKKIVGTSAAGAGNGNGGGGTSEFGAGGAGGGENGGGSVDLPRGFTAHQVGEILHLPQADHPGIQLVSAQLTSTNSINWSRSIRPVLATQSKLEFITGTFPKPPSTSRFYKQWLKVDYMVSTWIVNSILKEFVNAFTHLDTTQKLWKTITLRFGTKNGPKVYKLQKEIFKYSQGNQSVLEYFNNSVSLWDELDAIIPPLDCICNARGATVVKEEQQRLVKFLERLNDSYEYVIDQIMMLDPLPDLDKAYTLIVQVEDRKKMHNSGNDTGPLMSMNVNQQVRNNLGNASGYKPVPFKKRLTKEERRKLRCTHCMET